jgi:outer membrane lipoprotein SlyB
VVTYDAAIIEKFAQKLYSQANSIVAVATLLAMVMGGIAGASVGSRDQSSAYPIVGAVCLGALGYAIGQARAFSLRLQAQVALCQVTIERNTRGSGGSVATR